MLREKWGDLSQHTFEPLAIEGYRTRTLSAAHVRRMLGFETRMEVDALLKQHGVYLNNTDLDRDIETLRQLQQRRLQPRKRCRVIGAGRERADQ